MTFSHPRTTLSLLIASVLAWTGPAAVAPAAFAAFLDHGHAETFDVQVPAGTGGSPGTLPAFARALHLGVSTLDVGVQITQDGVAVVTQHARAGVAGCRDTRPAKRNDPEFPYVGENVHLLTLEQVQTLDCGGARMPTLAQVLALVNRYRAYGVRLGVEMQFDAAQPWRTGTREQFVRQVAADVQAAGLPRQVSIESFDWAALLRMHEVMPTLPMVALARESTLQADRVGASPWLGGIDVDDFDDSLVNAAASIGVEAVSPELDVSSSDPHLMSRRLVVDAHTAGMRVVPRTVNRRAAMVSLVDWGVDGIVTDRPRLLRKVVADRDLALPRAYRVARPIDVQPLLRAHAHNDYAHPRPLFAALNHGFTSVEADVWLVDGKLLVGHNRDDVEPGRSLDSLYLDPLQARVRQSGGVYPHWNGEFQLLIDVKSEAAPTYRAIAQDLREHRQMLTTYAQGAVARGEVSAVISGNTSLSEMAAQRLRYAGYDGRFDDLDGPIPPTVMPLVSDDWSDHFSWSGRGPMPTLERHRLRDLVATAHARGQQVRIWGTPDADGPARRAVWSQLSRARVDYINTDDLEALSVFLRHQRS